MECKEHLLQFMLTKKINLSHYDRKFLSNLQYITHKDNRVTTNQANLFNKLIVKYARQLTKAYLVVEELQELPWKTNIIESSPLFTSARISLVGDTLQLQVPFNKKFISEFKHVPNNPYEWNSRDKFYSANFSTYALKLSRTLYKYFSNVEYSDELNTLLDQLQDYNATIWNPTLTEVNGSLLIAGCNTIIGNMIKDIDLKLEPIVLYKLSQMGVSVDPELVENNPKLKFAAEFITEVDLDNMQEVESWIVELGCNHVVRGKGPFRDTITTQHNSDTLPILLQYNSSTVGLRRFYGNKAFGKCVIVKNSQPIDIK